MSIDFLQTVEGLKGKIKIAVGQKFFCLQRGRESKIRCVSKKKGLRTISFLGKVCYNISVHF